MNEVCDINEREKMKILRIKRKDDWRSQYGNVDKSNQIKVYSAKWQHGKCGWLDFIENIWAVWTSESN